MTQISRVRVGEERVSELLPQATNNSQDMIAYMWNLALTIAEPAEPAMTCMNVIPAWLIGLYIMQCVWIINLHILVCTSR